MIIDLSWSTRDSDRSEIFRSVWDLEATRKIEILTTQRAPFGLHFAISAAYLLAIGVYVDRNPMEIGKITMLLHSCALVTLSNSCCAAFQHKTAQIQWKRLCRKSTGSKVLHLFHAAKRVAIRVIVCRYLRAESVVRFSYVSVVFAS